MSPWSMPEWKDDADEAARWRPALELSSFIGCQSMGCMRWSNCLERPNFHLRKTVQMMKTPPTDAAMMIMTVTAVLFLAVLPDCSSGTEAVSSAAEEVAVCVTVFLLESAVSVMMITSSLVASVVWGASVVEDEDVVEEEVVEGEEEEDKDDDEEDEEEEEVADEEVEAKVLVVEADVDELLVDYSSS